MLSLLATDVFRRSNIPEVQRRAVLVRRCALSSALEATAGREGAVRRRRETISICGAKRGTVTIQECPCGHDYEYHRDLIWQLIAAWRGKGTHFVTLDPFMLANVEMWNGLMPGIRVLKPSEMVKEIT
jgi:hypothetical protein